MLDAFEHVATFLHGDERLALSHACRELRPLAPRRARLRPGHTLDFLEWASAAQARVSAYHGPRRPTRSDVRRLLALEAEFPPSLAGPAEAVCALLDFGAGLDVAAVMREASSREVVLRLALEYGVPVPSVTAARFGLGRLVAETTDEAWEAAVVHEHHHLFARLAHARPPPCTAVRAALRKPGPRTAQALWDAGGLRLEPKHLPWCHAEPTLDWFLARVRVDRQLLLIHLCVRGLLQRFLGARGTPAEKLHVVVHCDRPAWVGLCEPPAGHAWRFAASEGMLDALHARGWVPRGAYLERFHRWFVARGFRYADDQEWLDLGLGVVGHGPLRPCRHWGLVEEAVRAGRIEATVPLLLQAVNAEHLPLVELLVGRLRLGPYEKMLVCSTALLVDRLDVVQGLGLEGVIPWAMRDMGRRRLLMFLAHNASLARYLAPHVTAPMLELMCEEEAGDALEGWLGAGPGEAGPGEAGPGEAGPGEAGAKVARVLAKLGRHRFLPALLAQGASRRDVCVAAAKRGQLEVLRRFLRPCDREAVLYAAIRHRRQGVIRWASGWPLTPVHSKAVALVGHRALAHRVPATEEAVRVARSQGHAYVLGVLMQRAPRFLT